jgi:hypothetical protein
MMTPFEVTSLCYVLSPLDKAEGPIFHITEGENVKTYNDNVSHTISS